MRPSYSLFLLFLGVVAAHAHPFEWDTERYVIPDTFDPSFYPYIAKNTTEYEFITDITCPINYHCNLQAVIDSMTCVANKTSSAPDYIKFYMYDADGIEMGVVDVCDNIDKVSMHDKRIIGRGLNASKVLIRPVGQRWAPSDFRAVVHVRIDLQRIEDVKAIKMDKILQNLELNFVDDAQYVFTMPNFEDDAKFPLYEGWTRSVQVSVQQMQCVDYGSAWMQVDGIDEFGYPLSTKILCEKVANDQVTIGRFGPDYQLTISAVGDDWKEGSASALVVFTTQMLNKVPHKCPSTHFDCLQSCHIPYYARTESGSRSICIPMDLTCNKRGNCLDECQTDEADQVCLKQSPVCTEDEYADQLRMEVNKIGTWFVGLVLVLLMLICLIGFYIGLSAVQFRGIKSAIMVKLNEFSHRSLSIAGPPSYNQVVQPDKQA